MSDNTYTQWGVKHSHGIATQERMTEVYARAQLDSMHERWRKNHRPDVLEPYLVSRVVTEWARTE